MEAAAEALKLCHALAMGSEASRPHLATALGTLADLLAGVRCREEALMAAVGAVDLFRPLAAAQPDAFLPDFATALGTLARALNAVGQRDEALQAATEFREAVPHPSRGLARGIPTRTAAALSTLVAAFCDLALFTEAFQPAAEAAKLHRELVATHSDAYRSGLAASQ